MQINFPNDHKYTRKVEIKHVTKQKSNFSTISYEFPKSKGDPYYPINNKRNINLFKKYKKLIKKLEKKNIFFEGRLASYRYLNMDEVYRSSSEFISKIKKINIVKNGKYFSHRWSRIYRKPYCRAILK